MFESYIGIVQFNSHERSELTSIFTSDFTSESSVILMKFFTVVQENHVKRYKPWNKQFINYSQRGNILFPTWECKASPLLIIVYYCVLILVDSFVCYS